MDNKLGNPELKIILTDKQKYSNDKKLVKDLVRYYEAVGFQQVYSKRQRYEKLYNLAEGVINPEDYIKIEETDPDLFKAMEGNQLEETANLKFFPIIPNIIRGIMGDNDKKYVEYYASAINPEHTNMLLEKLTQDLRSTLVENAQALFLAENPNPSEQEVQLFQESEKIRNYYNTEYRTEVELWANHTMNIEDEKFKMEEIERQLLKQILVTEDPIVHVEYSDGNYRPEVKNEKDCFYLKSPNLDDYSESMMFGWFDYENLSTVLNKVSNELDEEGMKTLKHWVDNYYNPGFVVNGMEKFRTGNKVELHEAKQNWINFKNLEIGDTRRYGDVHNQLIRVTTMYFLLPRKVGKLTYKSGDLTYSDLVDENFVVTYKPIYDNRYKVKNESTLLEGEHVEWFFINELWKAKKLDINLYSENYRDQTPDTKSIWLHLDRHEIQYPEHQMKYGIRIPVHGGSVTNRYNRNFSITESLQTWQEMYNWIWNRIQQLLATEVGKFFIFNQNIIPQESFDGSWGKHNLEKFYMVARDTSLAPADDSITNMGQPSVQAHGGYGQVIDLDKTQEILGKANLARLIKEESFMEVGMTPEYVYGDFSPKQSARSVAQGQQRTLSQIQHIFTRLGQVMSRLRNTMLETAMYITVQNPTVEMSYMTRDQTRAIFSSSTENFPLSTLNVYTKSNISDIETMETIKQLMLTNNTLGADSIEVATMLTFKNIPELFNKLKEIKQEREFQAQKESQAENERLQATIEAQDRRTQAEIAYQQDKDQLDRETQILVAQIRALGYGEGTPQEILDAAQRAQALKEQEFLHKQEYADKVDSFKQDEAKRKTEKEKADRDLKELIELRKLELREKEIEARNKRTKAID